MVFSFILKIYLTTNLHKYVISNAIDMYIRQCHMFIIHNQFFKKIFRRKRRIFELLMSFSSQTLFIMSTVRKVRLNKLLVYRSEIFVGQIQQTPWPHHHHVVRKRKKVKMKMVSKSVFEIKHFCCVPIFYFVFSPSSHTKTLCLCLKNSVRVLGVNDFI